jgi:DNA repair protein RadC
MGIRDLPMEDRPREKLKALGPKALTNAELLAIILGRGTRREDVLSLSSRLLRQYSNLLLISEFQVNELQRSFDLSFVQACQIVALLELGKRLFARTNDITLRSPEEIYRYCHDMVFLKQEHLRGLYLNTRNQLIMDKLITVGTLNASLGHPREVLAPALDVRAASFILVHNHPSGDPTPSREDRLFTSQIFQASRILGIDLLDHIIVGRSSFTSLREKYGEIWRT